MLGRVLKMLLAFTTALTGAMSARAADFPYSTEPVRLIEPYPAGQGTDVATRILAEQIGKGLGQTIVEDNRPGAGGNVGSAAVLQYPPDGYTLLLGTNATHVVDQPLYGSIGYDPDADFAPVALVGLFPMVIVVPDNSPFRTVLGIASAAGTRGARKQDHSRLTSEEGCLAPTIRYWGWGHASDAAQQFAMQGGDFPAGGAYCDKREALCRSSCFKSSILPGAICPFAATIDSA